MKKKKKFELFHNQIAIYNEQISNLLLDIKNNFKEKFWKIFRIHWIKNREILNTFYKKKIFKKKLIFKLHKKIKIDLNLISLWRQKKFNKLCSTKVLSCWKKDYKTSVCRVPISKKNLNLFFLVQEKSGCVCCVKSINLNVPIWWDQIEKISIICKNFRKNRFFLFSFSYNLIHENFYKKYRWNILKKYTFISLMRNFKKNIFHFDKSKFKNIILNFIKFDSEKIFVFKIFNWKNNLLNEKKKNVFSFFF